MISPLFTLFPPLPQFLKGSLLVSISPQKHRGGRSFARRNQKTMHAPEFGLPWENERKRGDSSFSLLCLWRASSSSTSISFPPKDHFLSFQSVIWHYSLFRFFFRLKSKVRTRRCSWRRASSFWARARSRSPRWRWRRSRDTRGPSWAPWPSRWGSRMKISARFLFSERLPGISKYRAFKLALKCHKYDICLLWSAIK